MNRDEYEARAAAEDDWAPGWLAIDEAFAARYPGVEPAHYGTDLPARATFGGPEHLDGYSLYPAAPGVHHLVTYGMTVLYSDADAFGGEFSGWGYELTQKVAGETPADCLWAVQSLAALARYTYTSERWFEPWEVIGGGGPIAPDSALTGYVVLPDTEVDGVDSLHGRVDFLQLVGVTARELDWLRAGDGAEARQERARDLVGRMAQAGGVVTDPRRTTDLV